MSELQKSEKLIESLDSEIKLLSERIETEQQKNEILIQLAKARKREADFYKDANDANKTIIGLKDEQIANDRQAIEILKKRKISLIDKAKLIGTGILIGIGIKSLF